MVFNEDFDNISEEQLYNDFICRKSFVPTYILSWLDYKFSSAKKPIGVFSERYKFLKELEKEDKELAEGIFRCRRKARVLSKRYRNSESWEDFNFSVSLAITWIADHKEYHKFVDWDYVNSLKSIKPIDYIDFFKDNRSSFNYMDYIEY